MFTANVLRVPPAFGRVDPGRAQAREGRLADAGEWQQRRWPDR